MPFTRRTRAIFRRAELGFLGVMVRTACLLYTSVIRHASDDEPFAALAFKIVSDPFVGKLAYVRVYSGTITSGSYVYNSTKGRRERVGRILQMHANHREEIDQLYAGDIAAIVGLKDTGTGDTLCAENQQVVLESMTFPEPVIRVAIEPKTKAGQEKMGVALAKLAEEDPTCLLYTSLQVLYPRLHHHLHRGHDGAQGQV